ncbi:MAG: DNA translocase FtsK [Patescibacteria group bacterium]|nr:DNA translocase FtsK [Patescibacteria group bacterium]MDD4303918.1 DNA translocase FtsK [Patescibacteria group bacterium]MDD4695095.1 DNA translocase FtsK [Patescibacteria group bacterium]
MKIFSKKEFPYILTLFSIWIFALAYYFPNFPANFPAGAGRIKIYNYNTNYLKLISVILFTIGFYISIRRRLFPKTIDEIAEESYEKAKKIVVTFNKISATAIQRELKIGYAASARLLDMLEDNGIIGPANGPRPREVL